MKRILLSCLFTITFLLAAGNCLAEEKKSQSSRLGEKIPNLAFHDADGKSHSLYDMKDKKAIVLVFLSFDCPVSNSYPPTLLDLAKEFKDEVAFVGITTNDDESLAEVAKKAKASGLTFPVYRDEKLTAASALDAEISPEAFVLDSNFTLRYRGRIDNAYSKRLVKNSLTTSHDLKQALKELLAGQPVSEPVTQAIGCFVPRKGRSTAKDAAVSYYKDVLPILQNRCQSCHRPGEVGPFALTTYRQAVNWADDIKSYTQQRLMPPWKLSADSAEFHNDRRLSEKEIATLAAWVDADAPEGNPKDAPPAKTYSDGWRLGQPDLILSPASEFTLGPSGPDVFQCFVLPTNLKEDVYVTGVEYRPGNPRVVHHLVTAIDLTGKARQLEKSAQDAKAKIADSAGEKAKIDSGPGYSFGMGIGFVPQGGIPGWAPGIQPRQLAENTGILLPKGADIVIQVHYHRNGRLEKDQLKMALYFAKKPVEKPYIGGVMVGLQGVWPLGMAFSIPPGDDNFHLSGHSEASKDFTLYSVMPHMHIFGKSMKVTTTYEGKTQTLLDLPAWDYNWQEEYILKQPMHVKAGTQFDLEAVYDNSYKNPLNPFSPPREIRFGEQTDNEMCFVFLGGSTPNPIRLGPKVKLLPLEPMTPKKLTAKP